jgi:hypothetical protein
LADIARRVIEQHPQDTLGYNPIKVFDASSQKLSPKASPESR